MEQNAWNIAHAAGNSFSLLLAELMIGTRVIEREFDYEEMGFSLLLAELMIGTQVEQNRIDADTELFQSPISGVNDWNAKTAFPIGLLLGVSVSY